MLSIIKNKKIFIVIFVAFGCKSPSSKIIVTNPIKSFSTENKNADDTLLALKSFKIDTLSFILKKTNFDSLTFAKCCNKGSILPSYINFKSSDFIEENKFLNSFITVFNTNNFGLKNLDDLKLIQTILLNIGYSETNLEFYDLKTFKTSYFEIQNYGHVKAIILKKKAQANAEQAKFMFLFNKEKSELSIWDFDNFIFYKNIVSVDFQVKNKHKLYQIAYCKLNDCFFSYGYHR